MFHEHCDTQNDIEYARIKFSDTFFKFQQSSFFRNVVTVSYNRFINLCTEIIDFQSALWVAVIKFIHFFLLILSNSRFKNIFHHSKVI